MYLIIVACLVVWASAANNPPKAWLTFIQPNPQETLLCNVSLTTGNVTTCLTVLGVNDTIGAVSWTDNCTVYAVAPSVIMEIDVCLRPHPAVASQIPNLRIDGNSVYDEVTWDLRRGVFYAARFPAPFLPTSRFFEVRNATSGQLKGYLNVTVPLNDAEPCFGLSRLGGPGGSTLFAYTKCRRQSNAKWFVQVCAIDLVNNGAMVCNSSSDASVLASARTVTLDPASPVEMPLIVGTADGQNATVFEVDFATMATAPVMHHLPLNWFGMVLFELPYTAYAIQGWTVACGLTGPEFRSFQCAAFNAAAQQVVTAPPVPFPSSMPRGALPQW